MKRRLNIISVVILISFIFPTWSLAQDQTSVMELIQDSSYLEAIIPIADIPTASQETESYINSLTSDIRDRSDMNSIVSQFDTIKRQMNIAFNQIDTSGDANSITPVVLQNSLHTWSNFESQLLTLIGELSSNNSWMAERIEEISRLRVLWRNTGLDATKNEAENAVIDRINSIRDKLVEMDKLIKSEFNVGLKYEVEISGSLEVAKNEIAVLRNIETMALKNLLIPDSPPLFVAWKTLKESEQMPRELSDFGGLVKEKINELNKYYTSHNHFFHLILFFYIVLMGSLFYLKSHYIEWVDKDKSRNAFMVILNKPIATSTILLLTLIRYLSPAPTLLMLEGMFLVSLFPILSIVLAITEKSFHKYLYGITLILVVTRLYYILIESFVLARLVSFSLSILMLGILIIMFRYRVLSKQVGLSKVISRIFVGSGIILTVISIISNLIGNTSMANITLYGLLGIILKSIAIYIMFLILSGLNSTILKSPIIQKSYLIHNFTDKVEQRVNKFLRFTFFVLWLRAILVSFNLFESFYSWIYSILTTPLIVGELELSLWNTFIFIFTIWLSVLLSRLVTFILEEEVYKRANTPIGVSATITSILKFAFIVMGFFFAITAAGFSLNNVTILLSAFGVGIGFGLQNIFNNLVSGIILATERPVEVGDTVEVGALIGEVKNIGLRSSVVRTWDGAEVIVPNGDLVSQQFINWTLSDRQRRIKIPVGVAYGTDPHKVMEILNKIASEEDRLLKLPAPSVLFQGFGESSLDFELRCWTSDFDHWFHIQSDLVFKIHDALYENDIEIPFPQRDLHVRSVDEKILNKTVSQATPTKKIPRKS